MSEDNGQPSIDKLASEGISIRKCIASGENYGANPGGGGIGSGKAKSGGGAKPKGALSGLRMKGGY